MSAPTQTPIAVSMWEYSWLLRRSGDEAEYADWDHVLDELVERGYNALRLDAFPHLIARAPDGSQQEIFTVTAVSPGSLWGKHQDAEVNPSAGLIEFLRKCRARGVKVGLSSWFNDDTTHRYRSVTTPQDFTRVWRETLELLEHQGLLDLILWVDLCNEFPLAFFCHGAYQHIFQGNGRVGSDYARNLAAMPATLQRLWSPDELRRANQYLAGSIPALKAQFPDLPFTFSFQWEVSDSVGGLDLSAFDVLEPHIWLSDHPGWARNSGQMDVMNGRPGGLRRHAEYMRVHYPAGREQYLMWLAERLDFWKQVSLEHGLPLITTEAWGPVFYDDTRRPADWDWVKDISAAGVQMAIERGWSGICTSNFSQPHFKGLWSDVAWHRALNQAIRNASTATLR